MNYWIEFKGDRIFDSLKWWIICQIDLDSSFYFMLIGWRRFLEIQRGKNERERTIFDKSVTVGVNGIFVNFGQNSPNEGTRGVLCVVCARCVKSFNPIYTKFAPLFSTIMKIKWPKLWHNPSNTTDFIPLDILISSSL